MNIGAGVMIRFAANTMLYVRGTLNATGTSGNHVVFTSYRDGQAGVTAGDWKQLRGLDGSINLSWAEVRYGGSYSAGDALYHTGSGGLTMQYSVVRDSATNGIQLNSSAASSIKGSSIHDCGNYGIQLSAGTQATIIKNNIYNNKVGIYADSSANPTVGGTAGNGNNVYNNTLYSLQNVTPAITVNARHNYWGSAAGPYHASSNTGGNQNSKVSDYVDYGNWSPAPAGSVAINNGAAYTTSSYVTLALTCSDASGCEQMQFSNDGVTYGNLTAYADTAPWQLSGTQGSVTVYARFLYGTGDLSPAYQATIILDTVPPGKTLLTPPASPTINRRPTWSWISGGGGNGNYRYQLTGDPGWNVTTATSFTPTIDLATGMYTFSIQERDDAGNWSAINSADVWVQASKSLSAMVNGYGYIQGTSSLGQQYLCSKGICLTLFSILDNISLSAVPATGFAFAGWSDGCTATSGPCSLDFFSDRSITATFTSSKGALLFAPDMSPHDTLIDAYAAAPDNGSATIIGQAVIFAGPLTLNRNVTVTLLGGFDPSFNAQTGMSVVQGNLTVAQGSLVVDMLVLK